MAGTSGSTSPGNRHCFPRYLLSVGLTPSTTGSRTGSASAIRHGSFWDSRRRRNCRRRWWTSKCSPTCVSWRADLPPDKLVRLFRHCKIKRIDRVFEFQLDKRQLRETVAQEQLGRRLRELLEESGPLPATIDSLLRSCRPTGGGAIRIRGCSASVQPESAEVLDAIRRHSRLKGY